MSNFEFLNKKWPALASLGLLAEKNLYTDSNTTFMKCGLLVEKIVDIIMHEERVSNIYGSYKMGLSEKITLLKKEDLISEEIRNIFDVLRKTRNKAAHGDYNNEQEAVAKLKLTYTLCVWFMETYGDWNFKAKEFVLPSEDETKTGYDDKESLEKEYLTKIKELEKQLNELQNKEKTEEEKEESKLRKKHGQEAAKRIKYSEEETRLLIDEQLRQAGWEADTNNLRFSKGTIPQKNRNLAIAEWPTAEKIKGKGHVDYALFIGTKLVGLIEAKKYSKDVAGTISETKIYAERMAETAGEYIVSKWDNYDVPFLFAANGREYIKEIEDKSGIHFWDCRKKDNVKKVLHGWPSPENLEAKLNENKEAASEKLKNMSFDFLENPSGLGLRYYQKEAIKKVEEAMDSGRNTALVAMATGTGKTRTVLGLIYRLLKSSRCRRILFLVDRTALGEQAFDTFKDVKIENLKTLNEIYNIKALGDKVIDKETKVHVATVQAMMKRIIYNTDGNDMPCVEDYDCIIVDEAHRGYTLDKEISMAEIEWRDNKDFLSKYKKVLDYFDGFKVALTATPALHTTSIFGPPVYTYSYRNAVIDGYLVDHEPPHIIETELTKEGLHLHKGEKVIKYNKYTGDIINSAELEDELDYNVDQFNKKVIIDSYTKAALEEVAEYIDPMEDQEKTLIFAANDAHADAVVRILKEIYIEKYGSIDEDSIAKITGSIKDTDIWIKKFKNEKYPNIAVTVDLLSTGVDVPKIEKIVFLRRVKSRILYEQMLGRATRLCDEINKTHFEIFDCVNLYEALKDVNTMRPVAAGKGITYRNLFNSMKTMQDEEEKKAAVETFLAKLQRSKKLLDNNEKVIFAGKCNGKKPEEFIKEIKNSDPDKAIEIITSNEELIDYLDEKTQSDGTIIISDREDKVVSHTRGYGNGKRPEDYLNEFTEYINENRNKINALEVICTSPEKLTKHELKELRIILDGAGYNEEYLKTAWKDLKREDIAADIIAFIRQQALGSPLETNEERVKKAVAKIKSNYDFNKRQKNILDKIEKVMVNDTIIDKDTFNTGSFKSQFGGYERINKMFDENLEKIIEDLKYYMFKEKISV